MQKSKLLIFLFCICSSILLPPVEGQTVGIGGGIGLRANFETESWGFAQTVYVNNNFTDKFGVKLGLGHSLAESQSEIFLSNANSTLIRHKGQPVPKDTYSIFTWTEDAFHPISLPGKGNRYDDIYVYCVGNYKLLSKKKYRGTFGLGAGIHKKDNTEQIGTINAEEFVIQPFGDIINDLDIPIFAYNTFLDYSLIAEAAYGYNLTERLNILLESNLLIYPKSKTVSLNLGLGFKVDF